MTIVSHPLNASTKCVNASTKRKALRYKVGKITGPSATFPQPPSNSSVTPSESGHICKDGDCAWFQFHELPSARIAWVLLLIQATSSTSRDQYWLTDTKSFTVGTSQDPGQVVNNVFFHHGRAAYWNNNNSGCGFLNKRNSFSAIYKITPWKELVMYFASAINIQQCLSHQPEYTGRHWSGNQSVGVGDTPLTYYS